MFKNREEAAMLLAKKLTAYKNKNGIVLAVPRGGVPIGYIIAGELNFPLEIILSKKIGHPLSPEFAIGSVTLQGLVSYNHVSGVSEKYITDEAERIQKELEAKYKLFMGERQPTDPEGKIVIVVDDGIATGNTLEATIHTIRKSNPAKIVVAVPVAPPETADRFRNLADEFICLSEPEGFSAIGQFYIDFSQVSNEEVIELLNKAGADKEKV